MSLPNNYEVEGQLSIFDKYSPDTWSGRMFAGLLAPIKERTLDASLKKRRELRIKPPLFLDLRGGGIQAGASWVTGGLLLGEYMTHSFGESPNVEKESLLSQILEEQPPQKYYLSAKACQGILRRANKGGKKLPEALERALTLQATPSKYEGGVEIDSKGKKAGKGALVQTELSGTLSVTQDQTLIQTQCFTTQACGDRDNPSQSFIKEKAYTIPANPMSDRGQAVIYSIGHDMRSAGLTDDEKTDPLTASDYKDPIKLNIGSIVRRLTPLECERLQGYPDNWTNLGEWIDSKGKKHKDADSPRYKALGNSIALPFWEWMANRIAKQLDKSATMASLFDGIGGFPLVFSRCGVKPVWASEIEEFPIAVTKIRFPE